MRIQVGDPLLPILRHMQIAQAVLNIAVHNIPVKGGIVFAEIVWSRLAQFRIDAGFFKSPSYRNFWEPHRFRTAYRKGFAF
jgi:hypothetical protein